MTSRPIQLNFSGGSFHEPRSKNSRKTWLGPNWRAAGIQKGPFVSASSPKSSPGARRVRPNTAMAGDRTLRQKREFLVWVTLGGDSIRDLVVQLGGEAVCISLYDCGGQGLTEAAGEEIGVLLRGQVFLPWGFVNVYASSSTPRRSRVGRGAHGLRRVVSNGITTRKMRHWRRRRLRRTPAEPRRRAGWLVRGPQHARAAAAHQRPHRLHGRRGRRPPPRNLPEHRCW